jgi:hypothetical protein
VVVEEGELVEIGGSKKSTATQLSKRDFWAELRGYASENGKSDKWCFAQFRSKTGEWPHHSIKSYPPKICSPRVRSWIKAENIRFAKGRAAHRTDDEINSESLNRIANDAG